jgi:hypothetical protein
LPEKKKNQKKPPVFRFTLRVAKPGDDAASRAAMRRYQACSGAHNLAIAARLASLGALPDSTMLAASPGLCGRSTRKIARLRFGFDGLRQAVRYIPSVPPILGAGQRENQHQRLQNCCQTPFERAT